MCFWEQHYVDMFVNEELTKVYVWYSFDVFRCRWGDFKCDVFEERGSNPNFKPLANVTIFLVDYLESK